jgi:hypothetical protein
MFSQLLIVCAAICKFYTKQIESIFDHQFIRCNYSVAARFGEHDTSTDSEAITVDVEIVKTVQHPGYDKKDGNSDLAILYLGQSVQFNGEFKNKIHFIDFKLMKCSVILPRFYKTYLSATC